MATRPEHAQEREEAAEQHRGLLVMAGLAALTALEYAIAVGLRSPAGIVLLITPIALLKAGLIVSYFMHLARAWHNEGRPEWP